jgi:hypothetical protein
MQEIPDPLLEHPGGGNEAQNHKAGAIAREPEIENDIGFQNQVTGNFVGTATEAETETNDEERSNPESSGYAEIGRNRSQDRIFFDSPLPRPMIELIRLASDLQVYVSLLETDEDGYLRWVHGAEIRRNGRRHYVPQMPPALYRSLRLPSEGRPFGSSRKLIDSICGLLREHSTVSEKDSKILAYWSMASWFPDMLWLLPSLVITGAAASAEPLLLTLAAVCRRSVLLAGIDPAVLCASWVAELMPTLLIRAPRLSKRMRTLIDTSARPGYLMATGKDMQSIYGAKCIYLEEYGEEPALGTSSIHVHVGGSSRRPLQTFPTEEVVTDFQSRLLVYRFVARDAVATSKFRVGGFRPEACAIAESLAAVIVDDPELQVGIMELLKPRDEQSRVDRATGKTGIVLRAVLWFCHQPDAQQVYVRDIANAANRICGDEGESLKISSESVGYVLKYLGLCSQRLGNAGRGLKLDGSTQYQAHKLAYAYDVLPIEPVCGHCHELQTSQMEEVV